MKIAVLSEYYPPYHIGGYEMSCQVTVDELCKRGHDCTVITSTFGVAAPLPEEKVFRVLHLLRLTGGGGVAGRLAQLQNAALGRRNYRIARAILEKQQPDLVYVWRVGGLSLFPVSAAHDLGLQVVYELGDYWLRDMKQDYVLETSAVKRGYRNLLFGGGKFHQLDLSNIISISEALKRSYVAHGFDPASITVIPRGVPESLLPKREQDAAAPAGAALNLLYAGRIVTEKGVHVAVMSVDHLVHSLGATGVHLDIIGSGPDDYVGSLKAMIHERRLEDHVEIKGPVPRRDLLDTYHRYCALLFPSIWEEPFGNAIIEGMARGLPVIASKVGGAAEIIDDGVNGLLVPPSDSAGLAQAIARLGADADLARKLRTGGVRTVREKYTQKQVTDRIEGYLLNVAGLRKKSTP
jgi:glycogen synthase